MILKNFKKITSISVAVTITIATICLFFPLNVEAKQSQEPNKTSKIHNPEHNIKKYKISQKKSRRNTSIIKSSKAPQKHATKRRGKVRNFINSELESKLALRNTDAYFLYDLKNQEILLEKNADARLPPSSMTKIMTAYIVFDQITKGKIDFDNQCLIGRNVLEKSRVRHGSSLMHLHYGDVITVDELLRGLLVVSANDAAIALAEATSGSIENFVALMNNKAQELGLKNTHFMNPHGLAEDGHYMSVRDLATLAERIRKDFPQYASYFSIPDFTYNNRRHNNTNPLMRQHYNGVTGMKTGYTNEGRFGMVGTVNRDNHEFIVVVNHAPTSRQRVVAVKKLLSYGFQQRKKNEDDLI
jgi:D-alanyl-D-alanine carboxypeptidase